MAGLAAAATVWPMAQAAHAEPPAPTVPPEIAVEDGNKLFLVGHAVGVQIYACKATAGGYRWSFVGPRAELYGDNGKLISTHFGGPKGPSVYFPSGPRAEGRSRGVSAPGSAEVQAPGPAAA